MPSCTNYFGKIFAHLGAALVVSALSAEYSDIGDKILTIQSKLMNFVVNLAILLGLMYAIFSTKPGSIPKYIAFLAFAFWFGQVLKPYWEMLGDRGDLSKILTITSGVFVGMMAVGFYDKQNLLGFGPYLLAGLTGMIFAELLVYALGTAEEKKASYSLFRTFGIALFATYTAYDVQIIKEKKSVCGRSLKLVPDYPVDSLGLYLDFLNLFSRIGDR